jgi:hypothetical protein
MQSNRSVEQSDADFRGGDHTECKKAPRAGARDLPKQPRKMRRPAISMSAINTDLVEVSDVISKLRCQFVRGDLSRTPER